MVYMIMWLIIYNAQYLIVCCPLIWNFYRKNTWKCVLFSILQTHKCNNNYSNENYDNNDDDNNKDIVNLSNNFLGAYVCACVRVTNHLAEQHMQWTKNGRHQCHRMSLSWKNGSLRWHWVQSQTEKVKQWINWLDSLNFLIANNVW